jgi:pyridoxamine--pyruvate transaminase
MEFNLSAGPSGATPATLAALSRPIMNHQDPVFAEFYEQTAELLRRAFATERTPVILQGEAVLGLEAAAASAIGARDVVLNLVSGLYGRYYGDWARRYAREVIDLEVPFNSAVPAEAVGAVLARRPDVTVVTVVHCDTPSGTVNDLDAIATVVKDHGALLIVDAVSTFGGIPCDFDGWGAALAVTAPQKCLGGPPGLSLLHISDAAWERMTANPAAPRGSFLSILDWRDAHQAGVRFPFTPSVTDIYGLRACLEQYLAEGPGNVHRRHRAAARAAQAGTEALGLQLWATDPAVRSDTATAIRMPAGIDERDVRVRARAESGVTLSEGIGGEMEGIVLRIGHMGPNAYPMGPVIALTAIGRALRGLGAKADIGAAVEAAIAAADRADADRPDPDRADGA